MNWKNYKRLSRHGVYQALVLSASYTDCLRTGIKTVGLVVLIGIMIGIGVFGCNKKEPLTPEEQKLLKETKIAFNKNSCLYVMDIDGSNQQNLTPSKQVDPYFPSWSPDGTMIAFHSRGQSGGLYVIHVNDNRLIQLSNNTSCGRPPSWSPDSKKIVFASKKDGNYEIFVVSSDGRGSKRLTDNSADDYYASWSPDGGKIVFESNRDIDWEIYVMNTDGSEQKNLSNNSGHVTSPDGKKIPTFSSTDHYPSWSPDGRISFVSYRAEGKYRTTRDRTYIMSADGGDLKKLCDIQLKEHYWSPNGEKIAFILSKDNNYDIYIMDKDGTNQINLTNHPATDSNPRWSPDGKKIIFASSRGDKYVDLYVVNIDGSKLTKLTEKGQLSSCCWSPFLPLEDIMK